MSPEATSIRNRLSGHYPDISGLDFSERCDPARSRLGRYMYMAVCEDDGKFLSNCKVNPEVIRTYPDMVQNGIARPSQRPGCSPYSGSGIDISVPGPAHLPENQGIQKPSHQPPLLHIPPLIFQNTPPQPSFNSPYRGGDLDITGGSIFAWPEPQPITTSAARTPVLHIASPIQHIGAHHRQRPASRVRDSSGKPGAPSSARGLAANSPTANLRAGTPNTSTISV